MKRRIRHRASQLEKADQIPREDVRSSGGHRNGGIRVEESSWALAASFERTRVLRSRTCFGEQLTIERSGGSIAMRSKTVSVSSIPLDP